MVLHVYIGPHDHLSPSGAGFFFLCFSLLSLVQALVHLYHLPFFLSSPGVGVGVCGRVHRVGIGFVLAAQLRLVGLALSI